MKLRFSGYTIVLTALAVASGCVTDQEFADYKAEMDARFNTVVAGYTTADQQLVGMDEILACESRVDAYADMMANSDEVDATRRDEPQGTRRDLQSCNDEFDDVTNSNYASCDTQMVQCQEGTSNTSLQCRICSKECLETGSWPVACPLP